MHSLAKISRFSIISLLGLILFASFTKVPAYASPVRNMAKSHDNLLKTSSIDTKFAVGISGEFGNNPKYTGLLQEEGEDSPLLVTSEAPVTANIGDTIILTSTVVLAEPVIAPEENTGVAEGDAESLIQQVREAPESSFGISYPLLAGIGVGLVVALIIAITFSTPIRVRFSAAVILGLIVGALVAGGVSLLVIRAANIPDQTVTIEPQISRQITPIKNISLNNTLAGPATYFEGDTDSNGVLDSGEAWIFLAGYTIQPTDPDPLVNTAVVRGQDEAGNTVSARDTRRTDIEFMPAFDVNQVIPESSSVGESIIFSYSITYNSETGDGSPLDDVQVLDTVAGPVTYLSGDDDEDNLLEPGETWNFETAYTIQPSDPTPLRTTSTINGQDRDGETITEQIMHSLEIGYDPAISLSKSGPSAARIGNTASFTFTITNDSNLGDGSPISNVTVTDTLPGLISLLSGDTDTDGYLEGGEVWEFTLDYVVQPTDPDPIETISFVTGEDLNGNLIHDEDSFTIDVEFNPIIEVSNTGPESANVGDEVTYNITLSNNTTTGDGSSVQNVTVNGSLGGIATYTGGDTNGNDLLEVGEFWNYELVYTISSVDPDPLDNIITAGGRNQDGNLVRASGTHTIDVEYKPAIEIEKSGPEVANVGDTVTYQITIRNDQESGDGSPISGVTASDTANDSVTFVRGDTDGDQLLESGEAWVFETTQTVTAFASDPLVTIATVSGSDLDGDALSGDGEYSLDVEFRPAITMDKIGPSDAIVGDTLSYTITVAYDDQAGDGSPVGGLEINDSAGGSARFIRGDSDADDKIGSGEIWTYQLNYTVQPTDPNPFITTVEANGQDTDGDTIESSTNHRLEIDFNPAIQVNVGGPEDAIVGESIVFQVSVLNDPVVGDSSPVQELEVNDSLGNEGIFIGGDRDDDGLLEVGETWSFAIEYNIKATDPDPLENLVNVAALDLNGILLSGSDEHSLKNNDPIANGAFELGNEEWQFVERGLPEPSIYSIPPDDDVSPFENNLVLLGDPNLTTSDICHEVPIGFSELQQTFTVPNPPDAASVGLIFKYIIFSQDASNRSIYDRFEIYINNNASPVFFDGNQVNTGLGCGAWWRIPGPENPRNGKTDGWATGFVDLNDFRGQDITLAFQNHNRFDTFYNTYTYLDDVQIVIGQ